jgi:hypothetical protein
MQSLYLTYANLWALVGLILYLGGKVVRDQPTCVAFFGLGAYFDPTAYMLVQITCFAASIAYLLLCWKTCKGKAT